MMTDLRQPSLALPPRFILHRKLGEGAFGNVYEVHDREQQCRVALKSLERLDANSLFRFKREFRELADIIHPNLVRLHELFCHEDRWFFTMDLVKGVSFIDYVRPGLGYSREAPTLTPEDALLAASTEAIPYGTAVDELRLRSSLPQLVEGVAALHAAGKLHRDIKPQNVLVREDGRVVVLDFGLLDDIEAEKRSVDGSLEVVGTPAYMSPEAAAGQGESPASDWYSVGVMLYEALVGQLPFEGPPMSMLLRKQTCDPVNPEPLVPRSLQDLARLSAWLLLRDPDDRPTLEDLRVALRSGPDIMVDGGLESDPARRDRDPSSSFLTRQPAEFLVGREVQLALMAEVFRGVTDGQGAMLRVVGRSGMGKSALVRFFIEDLCRSRRVMALMGRCFECESVPYKALDALVDALTQQMMSLGEDQVSALLPAGLAHLTRLFPVLRRVRLIAEETSTDDGAAVDPHEVRRAAFAALRTMLQRLAERVPQVLWIDDLQWGDEDSAAFLVDLLQPPDAPRLLLIVSYRAEDTETSRMLRVLSTSLRDARYPHRDIEVGPLRPSDCNRLAMLLAGKESARESHPLEGLAGESGGSPLFLMQLVRHAARAGVRQSDESTGVKLDDVLWEHVGMLAPAAQQLLFAVALAGRSIELGVARSAACVGDQLHASLDTLRMQRLVRVQGMRSSDLIEPYHDRIREVVTARLDATTRLTMHNALAEALEGCGRADPEALMVHHRAAGNKEAAWKYAIAAADRARNALAFGRAADLYRAALEIDPGRDAHAVQIKLADALADAGHGAEAVMLYEAALPAAEASEALDLRRRAAEQALRVGQIEKGLALLENMLTPAGLWLPRHRWLAALLLLAYRAWLRIRGFGFRGRYDYDPDALRRVDIGWALATGLSNVDAVRGAYMQARTLLLALAAGEPSRIARALALEGAFHAAAAHRDRKHYEKLLQASAALASKLGDTYSTTYAEFGAAGVAYYEGRFKDCLEKADRVYRQFALCSGVSWERTTMRHYAIWSLMWMGRIREASHRVRSQYRAANDRGDLYSAADLRLFLSNLAWLADDDVAGAREAVREAMSLWTHRDFHAQHYYAMYATGQIDLYEGDGVGGLRRIQEVWTGLRSSLLLEVITVSTETAHLRARCALAAACQDPAGRDRYLSLVAADVRWLRSRHSVLAPAFVELLMAAVDRLRGDDPSCASRLRNAVSMFEALDMAMYAAAAARRLGDLECAAPSDIDRAEAATEFMRSEGIVNVDRWTDMLAPGFERSARRALAP
jgi:serine/threonine protein kinase